MKIGIEKMDSCNQGSITLLAAIHFLVSVAIGFFYKESTVKASGLLFYFLLAHLFFGVTGMNAGGFNAIEITKEIVWVGMMFWLFSYIKNCSQEKKERAVKRFFENRKSYKKTVEWISYLVFIGLFAYFIYCGCSVLDSIFIGMLFAFFAFSSAMLPDFVAAKIFNRKPFSISTSIFTTLLLTPEVFFTRVIPVPTPPAICIAAA